jgi:hypothetical protein
VADFLEREAQMGHILDNVCNSSIDVRDMTALCSLLNRRLFVETHAATTDIAVRCPLCIWAPFLKFFVQPALGGHRVAFFDGRFAIIHGTGVCVCVCVFHVEFIWYIIQRLFVGKVLDKEVKKGNSDKPKPPKFLRPAAESTAQLAVLLEPIVDVTKSLIEELLSIASHVDVEPLMHQSTFFALVVPILVECTRESGGIFL